MPYPSPAELKARAANAEAAGFTSEARSYRIPISETVTLLLPSGEFRSMPVAEAIETLADVHAFGLPAVLSDVNPYQAQDIHYEVCELRKRRSAAQVSGPEKTSVSDTATDADR